MKIILDIETTGLDPFENRIIGYSIYDLENNTKTIKIYKHEKKLLNSLVEKIKDKIVIGFNVLAFDIHFIKIRCLKHNIKFEKPKEVIDMFKILFNYNNRRSLGFLAEFLNLGRKEIDGSVIPELFQKNEVKKIKKYMKNEIKILKKLYEKLINCGILEDIL